MAKAQTDTGVNLCQVGRFLEAGALQRLPRRLAPEASPSSVQLPVHVHVAGRRVSIMKNKPCLTTLQPLSFACDVLFGFITDARANQFQEN